jgi:hypothetical protein
MVELDRTGLIPNPANPPSPGRLFTLCRLLRRTRGTDHANGPRQHDCFKIEPQPMSSHSAMIGLPAPWQSRVGLQESLWLLFTLPTSLSLFFVLRLSLVEGRLISFVITAFVPLSDLFHVLSFGTLTLAAACPTRNDFE